MRKRTARMALCLAVATSYLAAAGNALAQAGVEAQAWDGQALSQQASQTQAMFSATWGDKAGVQWAREHSRALVAAAAATRGLRIDGLPPALVVIPDGPPIDADTTASLCIRPVPTPRPSEISSTLMRAGTGCTSAIGRRTRSKSMTFRQPTPSG